MHPSETRSSARSAGRVRHGWTWALWAWALVSTMLFEGRSWFSVASVQAFGGRDRLELAVVDWPVSSAAAGTSGSSSTAVGGTGAQSSAARAESIKRLLWEIEKRTAIEVTREPVLVRLSDAAELHRHPLLYWTGDRAFPMPGDDELARLRHHLVMGGMLLFDSAEGRAGGGFDDSVRALVARLFPNRSLTRVSDDHVLFRSFYLLRVPAGRIIALPQIEALSLSDRDGRAVIVYSQNDLGGAWARDRFGQWLHEVLPGGEPQREQAFRLGVNLAMYALCLDYKADQVHVPFIMRRRTWQATPPKVHTEPSPAQRPRPGSTPGAAPGEPPPAGVAPPPPQPASPLSPP